MDLAYYREVAAFAQFGSDLDAATQQILTRGEKLTEVLKQKQFVPMSAEEQVVVIFAGTRGYLDKVPTKNIGEFEAQLLVYMKQKHQNVLDTIRQEEKLSDKLIEDLKGIIDEFVPQSGLAGGA